MNKKINVNVNVNMKGLRKGLKYIAQVFEEEQKDDNEIVIGNPTDVKHVAHIGWDGPAANSTPSWMDEFKANGDANSSGVDDSSSGKVKEKDSPGLPKGSRRQKSAESVDSGDSPGSSPPKAKKPKDKDKTRARRQSKDKDSSSKGSNRSMNEDELSADVPNIPKKTSRRKKSKDDGSSVKSTRKSGDPSSRSKHGKKSSVSEEGSTKSNNSNDVLG